MVVIVLHLTQPDLPQGGGFTTPLMRDRGRRKGLKSSKITYYLSWVKFNKELPACVNQ